MNFLSALLTIVIGICNSGMSDSLKVCYENCLRDSGAEMIIFDQYATSDSLAEALMSQVDALIIPGKTGRDTAKRYTYDRKMIKACEEAGKPMLGICLGHQHINAYYKGKTKKNVEINPDALVHRKTVEGYNLYLNQRPHKIIIEKNSLIYKLLGNKRKVKVNTSHNFSVSQIGNGLRVTAVAPDGIVEVIEGENILGVQFHPEVLYGRHGFKQFLPIFQWLVNTAATLKETRTAATAPESDGCCE